jgi:Zn-dependent M28 family amino/carboxypeptidase
VSARAVLAHVRALERVADRHGGNRAAGSAGDRASARYAAARLRAAGYRVRLEPVRFPYFRERSRPRLRVPGVPARRLGEVRTMAFSAGGRARGAVQPVDVELPPAPVSRSDSGCEASDFGGFRRGRIALIQRGTCTLRRKVANAQRAGAPGVVIFNEGQRGRTDAIAGSLGGPGLRVPAVFVGHAAGVALSRARGEVVLAVNAISERRTTHNVVADSPFGRGRERVMLGAHLDSVPGGAGANDNASGVGTVLAVAERAAERGGRRPLRVGLWGAEELGLHGSRRHVAGLARRERARIAAYVNLDMVGSANGGRFTYGSGQPEVARLEAAAARTLRERGAAPRRRSLGGGSDHAPFERAGVPVFGLFSGAGGQKTPDQRRAWGGRSGRPYDPCYHRRCDRAARIDRRTLDDLSRAAAAAVDAALTPDRRRKARR